MFHERAARGQVRQPGTARDYCEPELVPLHPEPWRGNMLGADVGSAPGLCRHVRRTSGSIGYMVPQRCAPLTYLTEVNVGVGQECFSIRPREQTHWGFRCIACCCLSGCLWRKSTGSERPRLPRPIRRRRHSFRRPRPSRRSRVTRRPPRHCAVKRCSATCFAPAGRRHLHRSLLRAFECAHHRPQSAG